MNFIFFFFYFSIFDGIRTAVHMHSTTRKHYSHMCDQPYTYLVELSN